MNIYVLEGSQPTTAHVEVFELDHETPHCLYLKVRGSIAKKAKGTFGFRWFRSEDELRQACRNWITKEITAAETRLQSLRAITEMDVQTIPPDARKVSPREIKI